MAIRLNVISVFIIVTSAALIGMVMGGLFGFAAGSIGPDIFRHVIPWEEFEPVGTATVLGASAGVLCGAALGTFGILVQAVANWFNRRKPSSA